MSHFPRSHRLSRRSLLQGLSAGSLVMLAGSGRAKATPVITIHHGLVGSGFGRLITTSPAGIAAEKGFFREEMGDAIVVEDINFVGTGPAINEAFGSGQLDVSSYGGLPNIIGVAAGLKVKAISATLAANSYFLAARKDFPGNQIEDLRGARLVVQRGTQPHQTLVTILEAHGLKERDVTLVDLHGPDALAAFNAGEADAMVGTSNLLVLRDQGQVKILGSTRDIPSYKGSMASGTVVSDDFAEAHPDLVVKFLRALYRAAHWQSLEENREELLHRYAEGGTPIQYLREEYEGPLKERFNPLIDDAVRQGFKTVVAFAREHKIIREKAIIDLDHWLEPKYQQQALKELGLEHFWVERNADGTPKTS